MYNIQHRLRSQTNLALNFDSDTWELWAQHLKIINCILYF